MAEIEAYEEDEDLMDIEMFRLGEEGSLATIAKNIKNLESRGVGNALRQTMEGYASIHESEARRFASEPMIGTLMENIRKRQIQDEWDAVARYQSILGLFSRKDSLFFDEYYTLYL
ncbi:hypothetical protein [Prochlorothrix hollandica]|uniref:hypothetical protein n=1 Tax=Prochlorothrix hollandica TaxID=1223 RepID=UPI00333E62DE